MDNENEVLLVLLLYVYILQYSQLNFPQHRYVPPVEYSFFEFSLDTWGEERQRRMMR